MTRKDLIAAISVGVRLEVLDHWQEKLRGTTRTVVKAQGNGYFFTNDGSEDTRRVWCEYPKRQDLDFHDDGSFTFFPGQDRSWRLRLIATGQAVAQ